MPDSGKVLALPEHNAWIREVREPLDQTARDGRRRCPRNASINGRLDALAIVDAALSDGEVQRRYQASRSDSR
jgi:hypothetical protein